MKNRVRLVLLSLLVISVSFAIYACSSNKKNPVTGGGGTPADVTITITGINGTNSYSPNPANITAGQTVSWKNSGGMTHTATQDVSGFDTGNISNGGTSAPITINTVGDLAYHCSIHGGAMTGTLHVTP